MENRVESLRRMYKGFREGVEDVFAVRDEAVLVLEEAKRMGDSKTVEEVKDMLLDLEFSIEENRCKCHCKCTTC